MDFINSFTDFEVRFLFFLQDYVRTPILTYIFKFFTTLGNAGMIAIVSCIIMLAIKKTRQTGIVSSTSLIFTFFVVNVILKPLVARIRPYEAYQSLVLLVKPEWDFSFPSGHASACFAVAFAIFLCAPKKYGISAVIVASIIAFSRLYVGVHYPSDVIIGTLIGCIFAVFAKYLCSKIPALNLKKTKQPKAID